MILRYTVDLETCYKEIDGKEVARVWLWGLIKVAEKPSGFKHGTCLDSLMKEFLLRTSNMEFYFRNLSYDGGYIVDWLLKNGYEHTDKRLVCNSSAHRARYPEKYFEGSKGFNTLVSGEGTWYQIEIKTGEKRTCVIRDSLKLLPFSIADTAKMLDYEIQKGEIDYDSYRDVDHVPTEDELKYQYDDVWIDAKALNDVIFSNGYTSMTIGSNAMAEYMRSLDEQTPKWKKSKAEKFKFFYPLVEPEIDQKIREAYFGGFTYANPLYKGIDINERIVVLDVNSMYPHVLRNMMLPYGEPFTHEGDYEDLNDKLKERYPLYIQKFEAYSIKLKKGMVPTVLSKTKVFGGGENYITEAYDVRLSLTNLDLERMFEHYDVEMYEPIEFVAFRAKKGLFDGFIDKWMKVKKEGEGALRTLAKLMLNSLYGKFGSRVLVTGKEPYICETTNKVLWRDIPPQLKKAVYTATATFCTSYARQILFSAINDNIDRFLYADTDSIHLLGDETPNIEVDPKELGAWKIEGYATKGRYLCPKRYIENMEGYIKKNNKSFEELYEEISENHNMSNYSLEDFKKDNKDKETLRYEYNHVCAGGMPKKMQGEIKYEDFTYDFETDEKLQRKVVDGGVILKKGKFTFANARQK